MAKGMRMIMVVLSAVAVMLVQGVTSKTLTVGDDFGWNVPPSADFYSSWAAKQSFAVGDLLEFKFVAGLHTVAQLTSENAYEKCDEKLDPNATIYTSTTVGVLSKEMTYYFICSVSNHCDKGQKLTITVPSNATTSTPESPSTPATPPSPSKNSALSISGFPVSFMAMVMSLLVLAKVIT